MGREVFFYHLGDGRIEDAVAMLAAKALERGWRSLIVSPDEARRERLDAALWLAPKESFLPHARAEDTDAPEREPVLISSEAAPVNGAAAAFFLDGARPPDDLAAERLVFLFDGADERAVADARVYWKAVKASGADAVYYRQNDRGGWERAG